MHYTDPRLLASPKHRQRYDNTIRRIFRRHKSWPAIAFAVELVAPHYNMKHFDRWLQARCLDRSLPLPYACALVEIMGGDITLFDFFPYLADYARPLDPKNPEDTRS